MVNRAGLKYIFGLAICSILLAGFSVSGCSSEKRLEKHLKKGEAYFKQSKFNEAEIEFKNALQIKPKVELAHYRLGQIYLSRKNFKGAFKAFSKTTMLKLRPSPVRSSSLLRYSSVKSSLNRPLKLRMRCLSSLLPRAAIDAAACSKCFLWAITCVPGESLTPNRAGCSSVSAGCIGYLPA